MGRRHQPTTKSHTLPSSPTHSSSSSSEFEFTISISPRKSSATADELFYKGQLLPLHLSPRLSMVRTLLSSSSTSSSDTTTTDSRSSTDSSTTSSARPSSATEDEEELKRLTSTTNQLKKPKYFTLAKLSSVFSNNNNNKDQQSNSSAVKRVSSTAKDVIRKYLNKVKPFYEKLSSSSSSSSKQKHTPHPHHDPIPSEKADLFDFPKEMTSRSNKESSSGGNVSMSFSGNLRYRKSCISSCPSSMGSSPSHIKNGFARAGSGSFSDKSSSMDELQSAIQGAIAHCKNSMMQQQHTIR